MMPTASLASWSLPGGVNSLGVRGVTTGAQMSSEVAAGGFRCQLRVGD
jgi:hypothetical protein